jgi:hypothetical protein
MDERKYKMKIPKEVRCNISPQGAPVINAAYSIIRHKDIVTIELDMKSKYCDIDFSMWSSSDGPGVCIVANKRSLYLKDRIRRNATTFVTFPEFKRWSVYAWSGGRYTFCICLTREA